jgi:hypothetical protein
MSGQQVAGKDFSRLHAPGRPHASMTRAVNPHCDAA